MFKTFPAFSRLTLADKDEYEKLINDYPAISDLAFPTLMLWWNHLDCLGISMLNGNIVISYWSPTEQNDTGLCLIGTSQVDESICAIFDHLREKEEPVLL